MCIALVCTGGVWTVNFCLSVRWWPPAQQYLRPSTHPAEPLTPPATRPAAGSTSTRTGYGHRNHDTRVSTVDVALPEPRYPD